MEEYYKERHVTTIAGPQAAAILSVLDGHHILTWTDKTKEDGQAVAELWVEITDADKKAGMYKDS